MSDVDVFQLLHRAHQIADAVFSGSADEGLTSRQFFVLATIGLFRDATQTVLVAHTRIDRSTLREILSRLERRGYIERRTNAKDRRAQVIRLTVSGRAMVRKAQPWAEAAVTNLLGQVSPANRAAFVRALREIEQGALVC